MTSTPTRPVDNVIIATKGLQDRNTNIIAGTTVENKGKLILIVYWCSGGNFENFSVKTCILVFRWKIGEYVSVETCILVFRWKLRE